jgi:NAD(P)-dependent dehydrogenase (short-subunit alcohol dehydrogenase family)
MATYLVTGTNRGIGLEFVEQLIQRGDQILATCRSIDAADQLGQLNIAYADLHLLELDVSQPESLHNFANQLKGEPIDIFINNAGVYGPKDVAFGTVNRRSGPRFYRSIPSHHFYLLNCWKIISKRVKIRN